MPPCYKLPMTHSSSFTLTRFRSLAMLLLLPFVPSFTALPANTPVVPVIRAHAHNDYEHPRPLLDALDQGFCSVEADVHLVDGKLLVAHDLQQARPQRTLQALYLDPLRERVLRHGGRVYPEGPEFSLLIDLKTDWRTTYPVLRSLLAGYTNLLTTFSERKHQGAVLVIVSGNRSKDMFRGEAIRYAAYDGQLADLQTAEPADLVPWISANWSSLFSWRGKDAFSTAETEKLRSIVSQAHAQGKRVRFWGAPDCEAFWQALLAADVDLINTDRLADLRGFLAGQTTNDGRGVRNN